MSLVNDGSVGKSRVVEAFIIEKGLDSLYAIMYTRCSCCFALRPGHDMVASERLVPLSAPLARSVGSERIAGVL